MKKIEVALVVGILGSMCGCESKMDHVNQQMTKIRAEPAQQISAKPVFETVPAYSYAAQQLRSPFLPDSIAHELLLRLGKKVSLDPNHVKQPLEQFPLDSLNMKGTLRNKSGAISALIQTPTGQIEPIKVGSYLGLNQGRVIFIAPERVDLVEIMPDGYEGYIERPRSLLLIVTK